MLCYVVLGDLEKSKQCSTNFFRLTLNQVDKEEVIFTSERNNSQGGDICGDLFEKDILYCSKANEQVVIAASLIVASVFGEEKWAER